MLMLSLEGMQIGSATGTWSSFQTTTADSVQTRYTFVHVDAPAVELGTSTCQHYVDLVRFERGIQTLLHGFMTEQPLQRPAGLLQIAEQIVQHKPQESATDVEAWARRLAGNVAHLTD
jgi:hypothetical protein